MLSSHEKPQKRQWDGPIYLPKSIYALMNEECKEAIKKYSLEALQKFHSRKVQEALCYLDDPTPTPGVEPEDQLPQMNTDHDVETPDDSILDYISSQAPNDEKME